MLTPDEIADAKGIHERNQAVMAAKREEWARESEHAWYRRGNTGPYPGAKPTPASAPPDEVEALVAEIQAAAPGLFRRMQ